MIEQKRDNLIKISRTPKVWSIPACKEKIAKIAWDSSSIRTEESTGWACFRSLARSTNEEMNL